MFKLTYKRSSVSLKCLPITICTFFWINVNLVEKFYRWMSVRHLIAELNQKRKCQPGVHACGRPAGLFFAGRMHATKAFTMLDPFQQHYGCWIGLLLCVPAVSGEVFWTASNLSALGKKRRA